MLPLRWAVALWSLLPSLVCSAPTDGLPSAASFYVQNLPDLHQDPDRPLHIYAGHISADPDASKVPATTVTAHLYFVLVKARRSADKERVMFWFNGGPGCSSFDGLMMEVGPWRVDGNGGLKTAEGGWEEYTTMIYIDQPAGTGFSYTSTDRYVHELADAAAQFIEFLRNFYLIFPEYRHMETYIGGESFAGQYIPYFSDALLNSTLQVPLMGAAIGNPWMDARRQYPAYLEYAVKHRLVEVGTPDYDRGKKATDECMALLETMDGEPVHTGLCEGVLQKVAGFSDDAIPSNGRCMNIYDVRLDDEYPACGMNWPPDLKNITKYLRRQDVVNSLHATAKSEAWVECQSHLHRTLSMEHSPSSITIMPRVLERIPVMIFAGDQDFICNYVGLENMIQALSWNGQKGLGKVETQTWTVDGQPAGTWVASRNLTYVKIFNASHMAGFDVPHVAHDMILRFMNVNFSAIAEGSALIPSSVGDNSKPTLIGADAAPSNTPAAPSTKSPEQDKAMWEAYYNAGSAALVLVIIFVALGTFFWCRIRKRRLRGLPVTNAEEESIPLTRSTPQFDNDGPNEDDGFRARKGKERATGADSPQLFDVGDSDEEDDKNEPRSR